MSQLVKISTRPPAPSMLVRAKAALQAVRAAWSGPYSLKDLKDPALSKLFGAGYENYAGIAVTEDNALTFSAVFSAVLQISADVAKLPLNLHKRRQNGGSDHYIDSRLYYLLKHEPNPETSSMMFRQTLTAHALTCHGGYAEIERDLHGRPKALWILTPDRVEPFRRDQFDRATGRKMLGPLEYRIDGHDDQILPMRDVIHVSGLGYDGITGYSVIHKARQAIGLALAMEKFGGQYFGRGTAFGGHLSSDVDLTDDQKNEIKESIEAFRKAQDSAWRMLVTGAGFKFTQFGNKPSESQMDESRTAQVLEVARFFRMPPVKLGVNTPGTVSYASSEQADLDYYKGAMLDWITREEQEFNRKLIPASERRQQFIKHNATAFLRADTAGRTAFYEKMLTHGVFNADDVLELEDLNPQPNGQGQLYLVQGAMIAKDQLVELTDAKIKKTKEPKPAPVAPAASSGDDDQARAIVALGEQLGQIATSVAGITGEQQARADALRDDLEAVRLDKAASDAAVVQAREALAALMTEHETAVARAIEADTARSAATTDREAAAAAAAEARTEAQAAALALTEAQSACHAAIADQQAAGERLADLQQRFDALTAELDDTRRQSEASRAEATAALDLVQAEAAARAADVADISTARDQAAADAEALRQQFAALETAHTASLGQRDADLEAIRQQLQAAETLLSETDGQRTARITELTADVERLTADLAQREADADTARQQDATERAQLQAAVEASAQAQTTLQARVAELEATAADAEAVALRAQQQLDGERASRIERMTATIAAHRGLIVDVIGRMARRECQQARAKQATPEKLRRWLDGFVSAEAPICVEALLPTMRVRLAAQASTDDPVAVTVAIVTEHMAAFEALVRDVLTVPAEDFHAELDRVLTRWETERAGQVADGLLEQEVRHVRSL